MQPNHSRDYDELRQQAIRLISQLSSTDWTDHNPADPGITILEQLCYVLTDLGYRIHFPVADLLAPGKEGAYSSLFSPRRILHSSPVSGQDYRKVLLDIQGVKNAGLNKAMGALESLLFAPFSNELLLAKDRDEYIEATGEDDVYETIALKGVYHAWMEEEVEITNPQTISKQALDQLRSSRALCTDFKEVKTLEKQPVHIQMEIELGDARDPAKLLARIWQTLDHYISPSLSFQSLEAFRKGKTTEEVFDGPAPNRGFLSSEGLQKFQKRLELRRSDIMKLVMSISPEVKAVRKLNIHVAGSPTSISKKETTPWVVQLDPTKTPFFDRSQVVTPAPEGNYTHIQFYQGDLPARIDPEKAKKEYQALIQIQTPNAPEEMGLDILPTPGRNRQVSEYTSFRVDMPEIYGITTRGLPESANTVRKGQAKQLSAYLLFFEQILADYFAQLDNAHQLFSVDREENDLISYYPQALTSIPATEGIFKTERAAERLAKLQNFSAPATVQAERSSRFLDHLLARFAEKFSDSVLDRKNTADTFSSPIMAKRAFIREYPTLSSRRGTAFNYTQESWDTANVPGLKKRIARLMGIKNDKRTKLSAGKEGFFLLENILLRPVEGDQWQEESLLAKAPVSDPYSFRLTYVFPKEAGRFQDASFRQFTARLLREETPAHLRFNTFWLNNAEMQVFEDAYQAFLNAIQNLDQGDHHQLSFRCSRDHLLDILVQLSQNDSNNEEPRANIWGIPFPLRDLPLESDLKAEQVNQEGEDSQEKKWQTKIRIPYAQTGVSYRLCDRNWQPIGPEYVASRESAFLTDQEGVPYKEILTEEITEDTTYRIRAEKKIAGHRLRYIFLQKSVRVHVDVAPVTVNAVPPEIDYNHPARIRLENIQANVWYQLYLNDQAVSNALQGSEDGSLDLLTTDGLTEDAVLLVKGSMDNFATEGRDVGSIPIRVRANPGLILRAPNPVVDFGETPPLELLAEEGSTLQTSVTYTLYRREIADGEFRHHRPETPAPDTFLSIDDAALEGEVQIQRLGTTAFHPHLKTALLPVPYQKLAAVQAEEGADKLVFVNLPVTLKEDSLFLVIASKEGHDQTVVINDGLHVVIAAILVKPDPSPRFVVDPHPVSSGSRGRVLISGAQGGVFYCLKFAVPNYRKQEGAYKHDVRTPSPRIDGVGLSAVEIDNVVGPPADEPLAIYTNSGLTENKPFHVLARKIHTGLEISLGTVEISVSS